jgi:hypothetical protein
VLAAGGRAVIMLYYRDSFNDHVNLGLVRRLRAHLLRTELGIRLAKMIWREPEEELRRHAELIREGQKRHLEFAPPTEIPRPADSGINQARVLPESLCAPLWQGFVRLLGEMDGRAGPCH